MSHPEGEQILDVTIEAVRDRFHTLNVPMAYFDGPAGTQVPDSVLEAVSGYMLAANANAGGKFLTSMVTDDVIASARAAASDLLGVPTDEVTFGANMTSLNFALSRTAARDWQEGDEVVVTRLDHDANISPWLELAYDKHLTVHFCEIDEECRLDLDHLRSLVSDKTKVVAFPMASNAVGTITPYKEIVEIAHAAGRARLGRCRPLRAARGHRDPRDRLRRAALLAVQVLRAAPRARLGAPRPLARLAPLQGAAAERVAGPAARDGDASARAALRLRRVHRVPARRRLEVHHRRTSGSSARGSWTGSRTAGSCTGRRRWRAASRRSASSPPDESPAEAALRLGAAGFAVWDGNYYAVEVFKHLGLPEGAIRIGIVHTNMEDEVDRLLAAMPRP